MSRGRTQRIMPGRAILIILLLTALFEKSLGFGRRRSSRIREEKYAACAKHVEKDVDSNDTAMDPHSDCGLVGFGIVQTIPYARLSSTCLPLNIDFASACIRCGMCIAIAEKINRTLLEVHESLPHGNWLNDTEPPLLLRAICDHCFEYYSLREINGKRIISDRLPGSAFVSSSADGSWERNLRNTCHEYLDEIGELQLYRHWKNWCMDHDRIPDLTTILCRSERGVLRDCRRMENTDGYRAMPEAYQASVTVTLE